MRHLHAGRKLGVSPSHRVALLRSLAYAIIERDAIRTTPARAKELRWYAERIVTLAKRGDLASRRRIVQLLGSTQTNIPGENRMRNVLERVYTNLVPRFKDRPGGYTQILRLATRRPGDNAEMCIVRYIPEPETDKKKGSGKTKKAAPAKKEAAGKQAASEGKAAPQDKPADKKASKKKEKEG